MLTTREFLREASHELFDWDGKIPATLRTLFTMPGVLTLDAIAGRRARWLSPLRVYLICSLAFFASKPVLGAVTMKGDISREINASLQQAMFLMLPVLAMFTRLVWRKTRPEYAAHLIAAFHFQAAVFGALTVYWIVATLVPSDTVAAVANAGALAYSVWYGLSAYRRMFADSWLKTIGKAVLVLVPYGASFLVISMLLLVNIIFRL